MSNSIGARPPSPTATASVQVVIRLRPLNDKEKKHGTLPVVSASTNEKTVTVIKGQGSRQVKTSYKFDNVFTAFSSQEEVFEATLQPVIRDVLMGFESTIFAYGQTGTGKTHTMEGDLSNPALHGVIPRSAAAIFQALEQPEYLEKSLCVSFLEIYNEDLCDLLVDGSGGMHMGNAVKPKLSIMEGKNGPFCRGLSEAKVTSAEEVLALMRKAQNQRQVGETNMNKQSSRSHCIFTIKVQAKRKVGDGSLLEVSGKLHCVDLAGSECAKSAEFGNGQDEHHAARERERMNINRSLLTLGRVVSMLKEQSQEKKNKNVRIPYRDSKLTRILQESLGGRCKTCLIATVSPSVTAIEESMSTLNYAQAANGIVNKPITSSFMSGQATSMAVDKKGTGDDKVGTIEHWHDMECRLEYMRSQVEEAQQALARKHLQQQELMERTETAEAARATAVFELEESQREKAALEEQVEQKTAENNRLSENLVKTEQTLRETTAILKATQTTEARLTSEAQNLISVLRQSTADGDAMYQALVQHREDEVTRKTATQSFRKSMLELLMESNSYLDGISAAQKVQRGNILDASNQHSDQLKVMIDEQAALLGRLCKNIQTAIATLGDQMNGEKGITKTFASSAAEVRHNCEAHQTIASDFLDQNKTKCDRFRDRLLVSAETLTKAKLKYADSSTQMIRTLEKEVSESKENLSRMVWSMIDTLEMAKEERLKSFKTLRKMVQSWKDSSIQSSQAIAQASSRQNGAVQSLLDLLTSEARRHEDVLQELSNQTEFLRERRAQHVGDIEEHSRLLASQREAFELSGNKSNELCNLVMTNIMSGVQDLLARELATIKQHNNSATEHFGRSNEGLTQSNRKLLVSAEEIFSRVESGTDGLRGHAEIMRDVDDKATSVIGATQSILEQIARDCARQQDQTAKSSKDIEDHIAGSEELDRGKQGQISESITNEGHQCANRLDTRILKATQEATHGLADSCKEMSDFVDQHLIENTRRFLDQDVEAPAASFHGNSLQLTKGILDKIAVGEQTISEIAGAHTALIGETSRATEDQSGVLRAGLSDQETLLHAHQEVLAKHCEESQNIVEENIEKCHGRNSSVQQSLGDYSDDVIGADAETLPVADRNVLSFSEKLSSTAADAVILEELAKEMVVHSSETKEDASGDQATCDTAGRSSPPVLVLQEQTNIMCLTTSLKESGEVQKRREPNEPARGSSQAKRIRTRR